MGLDLILFGFWLRGLERRGGGPWFWGDWLGEDGCEAAAGGRSWLSGSQGMVEGLGVSDLEREVVRQQRNEHDGRRARGWRKLDFSPYGDDLLGQGQLGRSLELRVQCKHDYGGDGSEAQGA